MTTLISLLGKSRQDKQHGYVKTVYEFDNSERIKTPFFGQALLQYIKPSRFILIGTSGSMWDVFFDNQIETNDTILQLVDAVAQDCVTIDMLNAYEKPLSKKLEIPASCLLVSYADTELEQARILLDLANHLDTNDKVVLDVTHGFRHLPMLALIAARYLVHVKNITVEEVFYGAQQMMKNNVAPVIRLGGMLQMLDWVETLAAYNASGNYGLFSDLLLADGLNENQAKQLILGAYFERSSNPEKARNALSTARHSILEHDGTLGALFKDTLAGQIDWVRHNRRDQWEFELAQRYLERKDYLRAVNFLFEGVGSWAVLNRGGEIGVFGERDEAYKQLSDEDRSLRTLARLRNALVHGVRSHHHQVNSLLNDENALVAFIKPILKKYANK